jgi:hypothetical protein
MQARSKRTEITADRVLAKIAFANVRDYWPPPGEGIHLHWADRREWETNRSQEG